MVTVPKRVFILESRNFTRRFIAVFNVLEMLETYNSLSDRSNYLYISLTKIMHQSIPRPTLFLVGRGK